VTISPEYRHRLIIMVKEPVPGRVKTRLARDIGTVNAAWWYRHQSRALIRRLRCPQWQIILAVSPDRSGMLSRVWPGDLARWPQGSGDLGQRMANLFDGAPKGPVVIIGTDIPAITKPNISRAFSALGSHDVVFGPAIDGGFWLVGWKHARPPPPGMFSAVRWSSEHALADSINSVAGARIALVDTLADVDTVHDL